MVFDLQPRTTSSSALCECLRHGAEVDELVLGGVEPFGAAQAARDAVDDVGHVGVAAAGDAVAVHLDGPGRTLKAPPRFTQGAGRGRTLKALLRYAQGVDGEGAQAVNGDVVGVVERVHQQPTRRFRGGAQGDVLAHRPSRRQASPQQSAESRSVPIPHIGLV